MESTDDLEEVSKTFNINLNIRFNNTSGLAKDIKWSSEDLKVIENLYKKDFLLDSKKPHNCLPVILIHGNINWKVSLKAGPDKFAAVFSVSFPCCQYRKKLLVSKDPLPFEIY